MRSTPGGYLEMKCLGCNTHQTIAFDLVPTEGDAGPPIERSRRAIRPRRGGRVNGNLTARYTPTRNVGCRRGNELGI